MNLQEAINLYNKPELADKVGHVYQVWHDGEITLQKSGSMLWERTLHCIEPAIPNYKNFNCIWPNKLRGNYYIFTDEKGAYEIRNIILNEVIANKKKINE